LNHESQIASKGFGDYSITLIALGVILNALFLVRPVHATSHVNTGPLSIVTSPLPIGLSTDPGKPVTTELRVKNNGASPERLRIDLMKFSAFGEDGKPRLMDPEPGDDYFQWVTFSPQVFLAEPGVWKNIKMTINVPKTAALGYYYAAVFSRAENTSQTEDKQTALRGGTATLVLLDVRSPNAKRQLEVLEFAANRRAYEFLPAGFTVKVRNPGNIHLKPTGTIFITRGQREIDQLLVNTELGNVLPDSNRIFTPTWENGFPVYVEKTQDDKVVLDDRGNQIKTLKWDFTQIPKFRFGRYHAHLSLVYDDGKRDVPLEAKVSFWVMPWRMLLTSIVVAALVLIGLYSTGRKTWAKIFRRKR
jgi:hypothetical protein